MCPEGQTEGQNEQATEVQDGESHSEPATGVQDGDSFQNDVVIIGQTPTPSPPPYSPFTPQSNVSVEESHFC